MGTNKAICGQMLGADCAGGHHREIYCENVAEVPAGENEVVCIECAVRLAMEGCLDAAISGAILQQVVDEAFVKGANDERERQRKERGEAGNAAKDAELARVRGALAGAERVAAEQAARAANAIASLDEERRARAVEKAAAEAAIAAMREELAQAKQALAEARAASGWRDALPYGGTLEIV